MSLTHKMCVKRHENSASLCWQAMWVDWEPPVWQADAATWRLGKLDSWVDPGDVLFNGSRSLHAVGDRGICIDGAGAHRRWERLNIRCAGWKHLCRCTGMTAAVTRHASNPEA